MNKQQKSNAGKTSLSNSNKVIYLSFNSAAIIKSTYLHSMLGVNAYLKHWMKKYPNLLKDLTPQAPEQVFVSDITYVKSAQCVHYLSLATDAYSRKIMGSELSNEMKATDIVKALYMMVNNRQYEYRAIHLSDRGLQYCS